MQKSTLGGDRSVLHRARIQFLSYRFYEFGVKNCFGLLVILLFPVKVHVIIFKKNDCHLTGPQPIALCPRVLRGVVKNLCGPLEVNDKLRLKDKG